LSINKRIIQSSAPYFSTEDIEKIIADVRSILKSGYLIFGKYTEKFERMFADYVNVKYAVGTNSGTSALEIPLRCLNVKNGCEVIVPTNTTTSSPNSVIFAGGKPVFVDIDPENLCIDIEDVSEKITSRTVGIMVVHIAGLIHPQIEELVEICRDNDLFLIEDSSHAHGALFKDKMAGSFGDVSTFSFVPTKVMTAGEGGMICTNIDKIAEKARLLRYDGVGPDGLTTELGYNWHPSEFHSVLGIYQLLHLEEFVKKRNEIAEKYEAGLKKISGVKTFHRPSHIRHSYYKFPILIEDGVDTAKLMRTLKEKYGVETGRVYYPPCHLQPLYKELYGFKEGAFPVAEEVLKKVICLPIHYKLNDVEIDYVLESLQSTLNEN
jgi:perosamine synthetase